MMEKAASAHKHRSMQLANPMLPHQMANSFIALYLLFSANEYRSKPVMALLPQTIATSLPRWSVRHGQADGLRIYCTPTLVLAILRAK